MNVGKGTKVAYAFLRLCAECDVEITLMRKAWVDNGGTGTQQNPNYVMLGRVFRGVKVVVLGRRNIVVFGSMVIAESRFVCVSVGRVKVRGVYARCGDINKHTLLNFWWILHGSTDFWPA